MTASLVIAVVTLKTAGVRATQDCIVAIETPEPFPFVEDQATLLTARAGAKPYTVFMDGSTEIVRTCGAALCGDISANARIAAALSNMAQHPGRSTPVLVKLGSPQAESLPWEALYHQHCQFLALSSSWPIARLSSTSQQTMPPRRSVEPVLRVLAVLAAVGVDATEEWNRLWAALDTLDARVRVHVLLCQDELADALEARRDERISWEMLAEPDRVARCVASFQPNIVHFFCHGAADSEPRLELARPSDFDGGALEGSIKLMSAQVSAIATTPSVWLVTLNCCKGARASASARSIAGSIAELGVPAVVAMRENVAVDDANRFTGVFYKHLVVTLASILPTVSDAATGTEIQLSEAVWLDAMHPSRTALSVRGGRLPAAVNEWTLPVIYISRGGLTLRARPETPDTLGVSRVIAPSGGVPAVPSLAVRLRNRLQQLQTYRRQFAADGVPAPTLHEMDVAIRQTEFELLAAELQTLRAAHAQLTATGPQNLSDRLAEQIADYEHRLATFGPPTVGEGGP